MEATSLKLLFIITMAFPVANPIALEDYANCSVPFEQISTNEVAPIRHDVTLQIKPKESILLGKTDITINIKKSTTNITLHGHDLEIDMACTMIIRPGAKPKCRKENALHILWKVVYCSENETMNLIFIDNMFPGEYILHIEHFSLLNKNENEVIFPYSGINEARWMVTNLYSSNAIRRLFPSWDKGSIKEYLYITVVYDKSYNIFMNIPTQYSYDEEDARKTLFSDIYQTSIHSIGFLFIRDLVTNIRQYDINYLWQESNDMVVLEHAHIIAFHATLHFKWVININLSEVISQIDHIVLTTCPMKSAGRLGLIVYRQKDVTYKKEDFPGRRIDIAKLVSYEMSRQLFIGIMNSHLNIEDKWFDEILASFYSFYIVGKIWLAEKIMELFSVQNLQTALDSDIYLELKPTIHKSKSDYGIDGLLYPLLYHKKAFVLIRMLVYLFTPQKFDEIIKRYVQSRNTNFWTIVEEVHPQIYNEKYTIKEIMDSWLTEIHHPEMHFIRNYNEKTVTYNATFSSNTSNFKIPFTYVTTPDIDQLHTTVFWCERNETKSISDLDSNNFLLVNLGQFGYYRVNYDSQNWLLLAKYLQFANSIPILNRAQIVNDAFYFTIARKMGLHVFFDVIKFLNKETSYIVWHPMFNIFSYMSTFLKSPIGDLAKVKFVNILNTLLHKVGYEERETDREMTMPLRLLAIKWACEFGHEKCRNITARKLIAYIYNSEYNIIAQWTNLIYCIGMMDANMNILEHIWQLSVQEENIKMLEPLTCIEDETILLHFLQLMTNITYKNNATKLSMGKIHRYIIKRHIEKQMVLNYFLNNYFEIIDRFPNDFGTHDNLTLIGDIIMNVHNHLPLSMISIHVTKDLYDDGLRDKIEKIIEIRRDQILRQRRKFKMFYE
ncbi:glutamyl aminopeptidase-like isoform X2 [Odontomachus brunneus]|nr:glutamyl aminopeptidase-like isoform X2 [Odontomachus brunneus]XP_032687722.1 glutamyl aminopeptidase-like isoform X2 [Odontomachus brunneus]XP_032687723.1 glutamyl aminopeptidase-like isoform X2 [Odontomachus brunneus]